MTESECSDHANEDDVDEDIYPMEMYLETQLAEGTVSEDSPHNKYTTDSNGSGLSQEHNGSTGIPFPDFYQAKIDQQIADADLSLAKQKPHICSVCNKRFFQRTDLKKHFMIHTKEKPHACNMCDKTFAQRGNLLIHNLTHTNEKAHICDICSRAFALRNTLKTHYRTHTKERPHICSLCQKGFAQISTLKSHLYTHSLQKPHVCVLCQRGFATSSGLKKHFLTHTKEKPYVCEVCQRGFSRKAALQVHSMIHTREQVKSDISEVDSCLSSPNTSDPLASQLSSDIPTSLSLPVTPTSTFQSPQDSPT